MDSNLIWWVVPGVIGGMPMPWLHPDRREDQGGPLHDYDDELAALHAEGVRAVVCLLNLPGDDAVYRSAGFAFHLMAVPNGMPPTIAQLRTFLVFMEEQIAASHPVAVHCEAGLGRTGTVIAAYLIAVENCTPEKAIVKVRGVQPHAIETQAQINFLHTLPSVLSTPSQDR